MIAEYQWKRFWCPRGGVINLSDNGFLFDPESEYGRELNPGLVTFDHLSEISSLALLGEPGIGKSRTLQAEKANLDASIKGAGGRSLWLNLRSFGSEDRLWKALFGGEQFADWRAGDYMLHLFLDSLDECLLRIDNVAALLADQLPKEPTERLRIRVACRTAPWPRILESALLDVFGNSGFAAYELAPLRRKDVRIALDKNAVLDADLFFVRVQELDASSLAIKPITLGFLIDTYRLDGDLPTGQIELYEKGCRILCEESNESRVGANRRGTLSVDQRIVIASRIAAVTQLCNRFAVWTDSEASTPPEEDVCVGDISGKDDGLAVTPDAIREALDTGLFSSRGQGRVGWAHQTYAEFLAARYCVQHEMPPEQLHSLLFHPEGGGQRLVPQLYDLAAWLSVMDSRVLEDVVRADPESLLGAAGASLGAAQRELVVHSLLEQSANGRLLNLRWNLFRLYPKLKHPGLSDQLRPYLRDSHHNDPTRHVAIDIIHACEVEELGPDLVDLAFDVSEQMHLRLAAGKAAADVGSLEARARLRPFALGQVGDDPQDELKGIGLTALWPSLISAEEIFPLITHPKERNFHGAYSSFIYHLGPALKAEHLPAALEWFCEQKHRDIGPIETLMDNIILIAAQNMNRPAVLLGLARAVLSRVKLHDQLLSKTSLLDKHLRNNDEHRHALLQELLPNLQENELFFLDHAGVKLVPDSDLPWIIGRVEAGASPRTERLEAKLVWRMVDTRRPEQMRAVWLACRTSDTLREECEQLFVIPLDSDTARILRQNLEHQRPRPETMLDPPPHIRIEQDLANIEHGNLADWVRLTRDLSLKPTSVGWEDLDNPDLAASPGWDSASGSTKERIASAALRYLNDGEPDNDKWFNTSQIYFSAISGFQALALVLRVAPGKLDGISTETWSKWVPIILKFPYVETREPSLRLRLLGIVCAQTPREVAKRLMQILDADNDRHGYLFVDREIDLCWDENLGTDLLSKVREPHLKPAVVKTILHLLLQHDVAGSLEIARSFIVLPPPNGLQLDLMVGAIEALISGTKHAAWSDTWPAMRDYPEFGRLLINSISYASPGSASFLDKLDEGQLGELFVWLLHNYPPSSSDHRGAGAMSPSQTAVMFRDQTMEHLKKRGTFSGCDAIRKVIDIFPQYSWLAFHLEEAESLARATTWKPVSPQQLLKLARDRSSRLVENENQLLDVVIESLDRLQIRMHGELPAAMHLWSELPDGKLRPKYEQDLSDYVALHLTADLRQRGIVLNREVQIRRKPGQKTDIHVDAVIFGEPETSFEVISVIIEAKGDWNPDLKSAMETQLRDDYLKDNSCRYGLYLVGWFHCDQWDDSDYRKNNCPRMTLEQARAYFFEQARTLSRDGYHLRSYVLDIGVS